MSTQAPRRHKVFFGTTDDSLHICVSTTKPEFCFIGATEEGVRRKAERALNFYFEADGSIPKVAGPVSRTSRVVGFIPQKSEEIEFA